jgi:hypothetical protein
MIREVGPVQFRFSILTEGQHFSLKFVIPTEERNLLLVGSSGAQCRRAGSSSLSLLGMTTKLEFAPRNDNEVRIRLAIQTSVISIFLAAPLPEDMRSQELVLEFSLRIVFLAQFHKLRELLITRAKLF